MDRSLDEIISERPSRGGRGGRGGRRGGSERPYRRSSPPRGPRREEYPRDGINKNRRDDRANIDTDWVHDRFEEDRHVRRRRDSPEYGDQYAAPAASGRQDTRAAEPGAKLRVENLHYDLTEDDINELFTRIGPVASARLLYDRADRSQGVAFVTYHDSRDAKEAIREFNGANANGQPIRISLAPSAPTRPSGGSLFDRVERRSLFERVDSSAKDGPGDTRRGGRGRSYSPRKGREDGRYVSDRRSMSPRQRGAPRERGRRPGARREESGRGGRKPRTDENGRPIVGGRPKKTAEELDAEMADYFGSASEPANESNGAGQTSNTATGGSGAQADEDIDMIS